MRIDRGQIDADLVPVLGMFSLRREGFGQADPAPEISTQAAIAAIQELSGEYPDFFERYDYDWARLATSYDEPNEAWLQFEVLAVLCEIAGDHPALTRHRPIVVRLLPTIDFASTSVPGQQLDYILIATPHFMLVREFAVLLRSLHMAGGGEDVSDDWIGRAIDEVAGAGPDKPSAVFDAFRRHAIALREERSPANPPLLETWLSDGLRNRLPIAEEIQWVYMATDRFLVFHELHHHLAADDHTASRTLARELDADAGAMSLMIARSGSSIRRARDDRSMLIVSPEELVVGPVTYLTLLRLVLLFSGLHRAVASLAEVTFSGEDGAAVVTTREGLHELEMRLVNVIAVLKAYGLDVLLDRVAARLDSLSRLYNAASAMVLAETGVVVDPAELAPVDLGTRLVATLLGADERG